MRMKDWQWAVQTVILALFTFVILFVYYLTWIDGTDAIIIYLNIYHEQLAETIFLSLIVVAGIVASITSYKCIDKSREKKCIDKSREKKS